LLSMIIAEPIVPAASIAPELPVRIDRFFERALARKAEHRFQSAQEFAAAAALVAGFSPEAASTRTPSVPPSRSGTPLLPSPRGPGARSTSRAPPRSGTMEMPEVKRGKSAPPPEATYDSAERNAASETLVSAKKPSSA